MSIWPTTKIGEVCDLVRGTEPGSGSYFNEQKENYIQFIRIGDLTGKIDNQKFINKKLSNLTIVNPEETLISFDGTPGVVVKGWSGAISSGIRVIRNIKPEILRDFLFYYLQTPKIHQVIKFYTAGVTILHASRAIPHIDIFLPPLHVQHQIVSRLDAIRKAQETNDKQIALAEKLFQSLLNTELDTKEKNWEIKKLKDITTRVSKGESPNWQGVSYTNDGVLFIRSENVLNGNLDFTNTVRIPITFHKKLKRSQVSTGDILLNIVGASIGRAAIFSGAEVEANVNQAVSVISTNNKIVSSKFILYYMLTEYFQRQIELRKVEGARANISLTDIRNFKVPLPSIESQRQIVEKLQAIQDYKKKLLEQKQKLQELFSSCLDKAMKGKLIN